MQQKLCLSLVMVVLFGALVAGNPFLTCRREPGSGPAPVTGLGTPAAATTPAAPEALDATDGRLPALAVGGKFGGRFGAEVRPASGVAVPTEARSAAPPMAQTLAQPLPQQGAQPVALRSVVRPAANRHDTGVPCPDPALRPHVDRVEFDAHGGPIWVLDDGRRMVRNPVRGTGKPLLVAAPAIGSQK